MPMIPKRPAKKPVTKIDAAGSRPKPGKTLKAGKGAKARTGKTKSWTGA
jgi:hypothetical protein